MDTLLGLVGLVLFIAAVVGYAALVTFIVIKVSPARDKPKKADAAAES
jgi:hypothetical protein